MAYGPVSAPGRLTAADIDDVFSKAEVHAAIVRLVGLRCYETAALDAGAFAARAYFSETGPAINLYIASKSGIPSDEMLQRVRSAVATIQNPVYPNITVNVCKPVINGTNVSFHYKRDFTYDANVIKKNIETVLKNYFDGSLLGKSIVAENIADIVRSVTGVDIVHSTYFAWHVGAYSLDGTSRDASEGCLYTLDTLTMTPIIGGDSAPD